MVRGGEGVQRCSQHLLLDVGRRVRQKYQPHARRRHREAPPHPGQHGNSTPAGDALDEDNLEPFAHRELDVLLGHLGQVFEEGQRELAQSQTAGRQGGDLTEPQPDPVPPGAVAFQGAPGHEVLHQSVGGGQGKP